jgi:DNA-directed RNA polymerase specialized sigma24 family protein
MQDSPLPPDHAALLAHVRWVERLTKILVADAHLTDDLAQDVPFSALERPPTGCC